MAQALFYSSNAVAMTLAAGIASGDTTCNLSSTSGLPASFPFKLLIGWGTAQQEVVHCTALSGVVATITRGQDGTTAQAHSIGATVVHGVSAREFNDLELHVGSTASVHGITGSVVGTSDAQTLTNKTFDATSNVSGAPLVGTTTVQTLTGKTLSPATAAGIGVVAKALASQAGSIQEWQNSGGTPLFTVDANGNLQFGVFTNSNQGPAHVNFGNNTTDSGSTVLVVRGANGQSATMQEWQNNGGTPLAKIDNLGNIFATNLTSAWTAYTPTFTNITSPVGVFRYLIIGKTLLIRGAFSSGTATAAGSVSITLPAASAGSGSSQIAFGQIGTAVNQWIVTTGSSTLSTQSLTLGTSLVGALLSGTIELA